MTPSKVLEIHGAPAAADSPAIAAPDMAIPGPRGHQATSGPAGGSGRRDDTPASKAGTDGTGSVNYGNREAEVTRLSVGFLETVGEVATQLGAAEGIEDAAAGHEFHDRRSLFFRKKATASE